MNNVIIELHDINRETIFAVKGLNPKDIFNKYNMKGNPITCPEYVADSWQSVKLPHTQQVVKND